MLLAKLRELKSCDENQIKSSNWLLFSLLVSAPQVEAAPASITSPTSVASIFLSLLVVVALIFLLAAVMRRFNVTQAGQGQLRVVASMMTGSKEKVMVIQVGDEQHLIGVTSHTITHLRHLPVPLTHSAPAAAGGNAFATLLQTALQGKPASNQEKSKHE